MNKYCAYCLRCQETKTEIADGASYSYRCSKTSLPITDIRGSCEYWKSRPEKDDIEYLIYQVELAVDSLEEAENIFADIAETAENILDIDDSELDNALSDVEMANIHLTNYLRKLEKEAANNGNRI